MNNIVLKYCNFDQKSKYCKATLASIYNSEDGVISLGISTCSKKDRFNRKLGETIAIGRAKKNPFANIVIGENKTENEISNVVLKEFNDFENYIKLQANTKKSDFKYHKLYDFVNF